jgi:hypothetical protein
MTIASQRAELRNWFYDDERLAWRGDIYDDALKLFNDGTPYSIHSMMVKEVREYSEIFVLETKDNLLFTLFKDKEGKGND